MSDEKIIIDGRTMERTLARLAHEIIEQSAGESVLYLVGIKRRGVPLAAMIAENIRRFSDMQVELGELDITLYRDDLTEEFDQPKVGGTVIDFDVTGKTIVLIDDVIYTGRTARAAMDDPALRHGRPRTPRAADQRELRRQERADLARRVHRRARRRRRRRELRCYSEKVTG